MGEIKSTLDLVMERTRHLSLSADEKARQQKEDFLRRLQGVLQQYADGALTTEQLGERVAALEAAHGVSGRRWLLSAVADRIDPDRSADHWVALLAEFDPAMGVSTAAILGEYRDARAEIYEAGSARQRQRLEKDYGIHGLAVVPNLSRDKNVQERLAALRVQTRSRIAALSGTVD